MNRQEYLEDMAALQKEVPELLEDIREYALFSRLNGDHDAAERAQAMAEFVEAAFQDILNPFAPTFSDN
jgi:hypothetical protein